MKSKDKLDYVENSVREGHKQAQEITDLLVGTINNYYAHHEVSSPALMAALQATVASALNSLSPPEKWPEGCAIFSKGVSCILEGIKKEK